MKKDFPKRKDTLVKSFILNKFPINPRSYNLVDDTCHDLNQYFCYRITLDRVKACHLFALKKWYLFGIINKFIYFSDKDEFIVDAKCLVNRGGRTVSCILLNGFLNLTRKSKKRAMNGVS